MKESKTISKLERGCLGKIQHKSILAVEFALSELVKNKRARERTALNYYECKFCGFYHIGHKK